MQASATQKHARMSPRKLRPYARLISGMPTAKALVQLTYAPGKAPEIIQAVLQSAIANATNNFQMEGSELKVSRVIINQGLVMKSFMPVAKGMAHPILKLTAHVTVTVEGEVMKQTGKKAATSKNEKIETLTTDTFVALEEKEAKKQARELEKEESKKAKTVLAEHSEEASPDKQSSVAFQKMKMNQQGGDPKETHRRESKKTHRRKSIG